MIRNWFLSLGQDAWRRDTFSKWPEATGVTVLPGQYLGREVDGFNPGAFVRMALVAEPETCKEAYGGSIHI